MAFHISENEIFDSTVGPLYTRLLQVWNVLVHGFQFAQNFWIYTDFII